MKRYLGCWEDEVEDELGDFVKHEEAQAAITDLQAQLAERDKTILEQQPRLKDWTIALRTHGTQQHWLNVKRARRHVKIFGVSVFRG